MTKYKKTLKIGTDFSGVGAPEQAMKNLELDHESVFACEIDKYARTTFLANHYTETMYEDITTRDHSEVPQLDLYVAGFPCQAFSIAGKRKGFDEARGTLFFNVAEFIKENQPHAFILENVRGLLSHDGGKTMQTILDILSNCGGTVNGQMSLDMFEDGLGYHIYYQVLNTKEHGIPQNRERVFIVGFKEPRGYQFPMTETLELRLKDVLETDVDNKYFLSDKMLNGFISHAKRHAEKGNGFKFEPKSPDEAANTITTTEGSRGYNNFIANTIRANAFKMGPDDNYIKVKSATSKGYEEAKEGDSINYSVPTSETRRGRVGKGVAQTLDTACNQAVITPGTWRTHKDGEGFREMKDGNCPTIPARAREDGSGQPVIKTKTSIRRLTPRECFRLQDFPDTFDISEVSDTQAYKQAGNSITVRVIQKVIANIYGVQM